MGCFSFLCKESGEAAQSTSFDGSPCHLFLLKDGKVLEHMFGNYDSYGRVFKKGKDDSFEWKMAWSDVCNLMFNNNKADGIAMILHDHYHGEVPTTQSEHDPNQGWGDEMELLDDTSEGGFVEVPEPFHKVYEAVKLPEPDQTVVLVNGKALETENIRKIHILANGEKLYHITIVDDKLEIRTPNGGINIIKADGNKAITIESK